VNPRDDEAKCVIQTSDGGYAIAGTWNLTNTTAMRSTMGLLRTDSFGQIQWIKVYNAKENATSYSNDEAKAMIRTSDGSYAIIGATRFDSEKHQDIFFVKTETLEQPPQTTPIPTPATSDTSTTRTPEQPSQSSLNSNQSAQTPSQYSGDSSNETSNSDTLQISNQEQTLLIAGVLVAVIASVAVIVARTKKKKTD
jgi:hypothetical protein